MTQKVSDLGKYRALKGARHSDATQVKGQDAEILPFRRETNQSHPLHSGLARDDLQEDIPAAESFDGLKRKYHAARFNSERALSRATGLRTEGEPADAFREALVACSYAEDAVNYSTQLSFWNVSTLVTLVTSRSIAVLQRMRSFSMKRSLASEIGPSAARRLENAMLEAQSQVGQTPSA